MKNQATRAINFGGKQILTTFADKQWWVAIKPVCEALGVDYIQQFKNLKEDSFFAGALCKHTMHDASSRLQEMLCIRERDVYGWLCSLRSDSPELAKYKRTCYDILYANFHGTITGRVEVLNHRRDLEERIAELKKEVLHSPQQSEIAELTKQKSLTGKRLRELDTELLSGQTALDFKET